MAIPKALQELINRAVIAGIKESTMDSPATEEQLEDATQLMMMISGRIMAAQESVVASSVIDQVIHHLEQADGLLAKVGLKADSADISRLTEKKQNRKA